MVTFLQQIWILAAAKWSLSSMSSQCSISITPENVKKLWFFGVFRGYQIGASAWNWLITLTLLNIGSWKTSGSFQIKPPYIFWFPWWSSQILLKFGWKDPLCNRNEPWKFQLPIISGLEFIHHWILCNFPIFRWSCADNLFLPTLSDNYILIEIQFSLKLYTPLVFHPN